MLLFSSLLLLLLLSAMTKRKDAAVNDMCNPQTETNVVDEEWNTKNKNPFEFIVIRKKSCKERKQKTNTFHSFKIHHFIITSQVDLSAKASSSLSLGNNVAHSLTFKFFILHSIHSYATHLRILYLISILIMFTQ